MPGWTSLVVLLLVCTGVIISSLGVIGLYVGKIFDQTKGRPLFLVDTVSEIHARVGLDRPGAIIRPHWMHVRYLADVVAAGKAAYAIVHTSADGLDDGWAAYSLDWPEVFADDSGGNCDVSDLWGASPGVELALWKFILELDLVDRVRAEERPRPRPAPVRHLLR